MNRELLATIGKEVSAGLAFEELKNIHSIDRWFTFPAFEKSASYAVSRWRAFGLSSAKVERFAADGRSPVAAWTMPYAWDAVDARLVIEEPASLAGEVICRYREVPCSLAMWSAPTPPEGIVAEVELVENAEDEKSYEGREVRGKIVFTSTRGVFAKGQAARRGAVGILSDFVTHPLDKPDETFWMNAWSDDPGGWGLTERDSKVFGFNISPRKGAHLRELLKKHGRIRARAVVDTRLYSGQMPAATAVIRGASRREEVLALGHAFEQGANDNASGCAVMLEAARALSKLIGEGKLPKPRRNIRFLFVSECYSTFAYCERYRRRMADTVAGVCLDSVGHKQSAARAALGLRRPPDANASFVTAFAERLAEAVLTPLRPDYKWVPGPYATTDNVVADPMIGPPTVLFMSHESDLNWHSTGDGPEKIDVEALGALSVYTAYFLYMLASASAMEALYFGALATARAKGELSLLMAKTLEKCREHSVDFQTAKSRMKYVVDRVVREVESVRTLLTLKETKSIEEELSAMSGEIIEAGDRNTEQLKRVMKQCGQSLEAEPPGEDEKALRRRAEGIVPVRKYIGTMSFDFLAPEAREGFEDPRWNGELTAALFWCDGKRTLAEALDLAGKELSRDLWHLVGFFEFLARNGLIELRRP